MHEFHKFWIEEDPMDIMEFNRVREKFRKRIIKQLQNPEMALCPHFAASEGLINIQAPMLIFTDSPEHCLIVVLDFCFILAHTLNAHSDCMHAFCTVFSFSGRNYQIPRYRCLRSTGSSYGIKWCCIYLGPTNGESFLFFQVVFLPLIIQH